MILKNVKKAWQGCKDFYDDIIKKSTTNAEKIHNALQQ